MKNSSSDLDFCSFGVVGRLPVREMGFFHLLKLPDPALSLFTNFNAASACIGAMGTFSFAAGVAGGLECESKVAPNTSVMFSSTVSMDSSRAPEDVVGARPESLLNKFFSSEPLFGRRRNAGCVSVGGVRRGATVTAIGGFAATVSSYRTVINPSSVRVKADGAVDLM